MAQALSQGHLHRCVEQAEAAAILCNQHMWLSAITIARALLETIAAYHHRAIRIEAVVSRGDTREIYDALIAAGFATRDAVLIESVPDEAVQATNILTQIDALTTHRPSVRKDYDLLSEYAHPNALGVFLFFGRQDVAQNIIEFRREGWIADEALKWVGAAVFTLHAAVDAAEKMEAVAQEIYRLDLSFQ